MSQYVLKQIDFDSDEYKAKQAFREGMWLYGFCNGYFGFDSYEDKKITCLIGNHVEAVDKNGKLHLGRVESWVELLKASNQEVEKREKYDYVNE
jgi:hypothetical protein